MRSVTRLRHTGHRAQWAFWQSPSKYRLFLGGVGSGKTRAGAVEVLRMPPGSRGMVVAPTYKILEDATLESFLEVAGDIPGPFISAFNRQKNKMWLRNGTTILWRSADRPDGLRGPNMGWIWADEAAYLKEEAWKVLVGRLRHPVGPWKAWVTTTPKGKNWIWQKWVRDRLHGYWWVRSGTRENSRFLPPGFEAGLRADYTSKFAAQELDGSFVDWSGGVFERQWFDRIIPRDRVPHRRLGRWSRYWDLAVSEKVHADFTASLKSAFNPSVGDQYLAGGIHGKWSWPVSRRTIIQTAGFEPSVEVGVEQVAFQLAALQDLATYEEMIGVALRGVPVDGDKIARAQPWAARAERGQVVLVEGAWVQPFLDEICEFPAAKHDDWVDAGSGVTAMLGSPVSSTVRTGIGKAAPVAHRALYW